MSDRRAPPTRFLCDVMLGRLARWLRSLGHNAAYDHTADDPELLRRAARERRTLVTRDTRLAATPRGPRVVLLHANDTAGQLRELVDALGSPRHPGLLTRCIVCNTRLRNATSDQVEERVPEYVRSTQRDFRACPGCGRVYWPGTHRRGILAALESALPGVTGTLLPEKARTRATAEHHTRSSADMKIPIRVGISSCLLGNAVRYDGGHKLDRYLRDTLGAVVAWVPICPEVECGLPVPREALLLAGDPADPHLVTVHSGVDHTAGMKRWAARRLDALAREDLRGFVFKSRSPSCGLRRINVHPPAGGAPSDTGVGIFARAFTERFPSLPVEDEVRLSDPALREGFIDRLITARRPQHDV
jgi:uncharacterized protein with PIN domain/uncharacterized protein YbbK (DUF523 family)